MKLSEDTYGQEIWAYYKGDSSIVEIVERDDGFIGKSGGPKAYFDEYKDWKPHEKKAMKLVKGRVLDIGCGAGRHSLYLQKKGFDVTGIDNSPLAIKVCKLRGLKKARVLPIEKISFRNSAFDTILMMGNNFGLFGNPKRAKVLLKKLYKMTSDDALIIAENLDPYKTKDPVHLNYLKANKKKGIMPGRIRIRVRFKNLIGKWFEYLLVSHKEMEDILKGTGWKIKKTIKFSGSLRITVIGKE